MVRKFRQFLADLCSLVHNVIFFTCNAGSIALDQTGGRF